MPSIDELKDNLDDIQGNVIRSYRPHSANYRFYHIHDTTKGREWLSAILDDIKVTHSERWAKEEIRDFTINVAFSHGGLRALGLPETVLKSFPVEFQEGMQKRAVEILGDEPMKADKSIPKNWEQGFKPKDPSKEIHALVILTTKSDHCDEGLSRLKKIDKCFHHHVKLLNIKLNGKSLGAGREHFGYIDGISQPYIEGTETLYGDLKKSKKPPFSGQGTPTKDGQWLPLKPGEFLLGYEDEFGEVAQYPTHYDLRKNGTYLVVRKLYQNVPTFQKYLKETSKKLWKKRRSRNLRYYIDLLAAKLMGRWQSGCPLELSPKKDNQRIADDLQRNNDFVYQEDLDGEKCPLGSHIRRTNPRDDLFLVSKNPLKPSENLEYHLNRHRIIRRGLPYGTPYRNKSKHGHPHEEKEDRGLVFIALNASISRQFEFIQQQWVNKGSFLGLDKTDRDPIIGKKDDTDKMKFTVPGADFPFEESIDSFVTEKGGEYFFYPGLLALRGLAEGKFKASSTFLSDYASLDSISDQMFKGAVAKQRMMGFWMTRYPKMMFDELREKAPIFRVPSVNPPASIPDLKKPPMLIATKYDDVLEILKDRDKAFSIILYKQKMAPPYGPFVLGMDYFDPQYHEKELPILKAVVPRADLETTIRPLIERLANEIMESLKKTGKIDVISDLVWPVSLRLVKYYFGVPGPDEKTLKRWFRDIYMEIFMNIGGNELWKRQADIATAELNAYLDNLIESREKELKDCKNVPDTVLTRLVKRKDEFADGSLGVRRNIFGTIIGVVETTLKAVPRTIDQLLLPHRKKILGAARDAALDSQDQKLETLSKYVFEAMRFNPQNHVIFRVCLKPTKLRGVQVNPGTLVFAATYSAMFDADVLEAPEAFRVDRPENNYLFFGHEHHKCLGEYISRVQLPILVKHVIALEELKRAKGGDKFDPMETLPQHFMLTFKAPSSV